MHQKGMWELLGINPTSDAKIIKKAYAKQLKRYHPETDPEGYQQLRSAYDTAMRLSKLGIRYQHEQDDAIEVVEETQPKPLAEQVEDTGHQFDYGDGQRQQAEIEKGGAGRVIEVDWHYGDGEQPHAAEDDADGRRLESDWHYGDGRQKPQTTRVAVGKRVVKPGPEERLKAFIAEAEMLIDDPSGGNDVLLWADMFNRYDDILWDDSHHVVAGSMLFSAVASRRFAPERELWQMLEDCFGWSESIMRNRAHYEGEYGEQYIRSYMQYSDTPAFSANQRTQSGRAKKANGGAKRSFYFILIAVMLPNLLRIMVKTSSSPPPNVKPAYQQFQPLPAPTLDSGILHNKEELIEQIGYDPFEVKFDARGKAQGAVDLFNRFGGVGFADMEQADKSLREMIQNQDWQALADYVDVYSLVGEFYTDMEQGEDVDVFFTRLMENKFTELAGEGGWHLTPLNEGSTVAEGHKRLSYSVNGQSVLELDLIECDGVWLLAFLSERYTAAAQEVYLYREPNIQLYLEQLEAKTNAVMPMYMLSNESECVMSVLFKWDQRFESIKVAMGEFGYNMELESSESDVGARMLHLHLEEEPRFITGFYGITEDGESVELEVLK